MSEFDPTAASQTLESILGNGAFGRRRVDPASRLDDLSKQGLLTGNDAQELRALLTRVTSAPEPSAPPILPEIDAVLGRAKSEVAVTILKTLRFILSTHPTAADHGQAHQRRSIPEIPYDPDAASEGCLEGALGGAAVGAALGGVPGALAGAAVGGILGGWIRGFGAGWGE